jgi:hypothetical protein
LSGSFGRSLSTSSPYELSFGCWPLSAMLQNKSSAVLLLRKWRPATVVPFNRGHAVLDHDWATHLLTSYPNREDVTQQQPKEMDSQTTQEVCFTRSSRSSKVSWSAEGSTCLHHRESTCEGIPTNKFHSLCLSALPMWTGM